MDPFLDPQIDRFWDLKTMPKMNIFGPQHGPNMDKKKQKQIIVYSSVLSCTLVYSSVL